MEVLSVHVPVSNGYILYRGILFRSSFKTFSAHWNTIHFLVATVISARNLLPSLVIPSPVDSSSPLQPTCSHIQCRYTGVTGSSRKCIMRPPPRAHRKRPDIRT